MRAEVNGFQNPSVGWESSWRGEAQFGLFNSRHHQDFRDVPVIQDRIGGEVFSYFAKAGFEARLAPPRRSRRTLRRKQCRPCGQLLRLRLSGCKRQVRGGLDNSPGWKSGGAAGILLAAKLGQSVDGFCEQIWRGVIFLVPARVLWRHRGI